MSEPRWNFADTGGGIQGGFSDAIQELFDTDREKYIARETIQNSLDARDDANKPVIVKFRRIFIPPSDIPRIDQLEHIMRRCYDFPPNGEKAKKFFSKSLLLMKQQKISVLSIEDYNTVGITGGDYDYSDRWYRLIKSEGVVARSSEAGGGSFGVGKGAPFVASGLRTVLYSTWDKYDKVAFQGVSRLTSYLDENKITHQRVGFYGVDQSSGVPDSLAIRTQAEIPEIFRRSEKGTSIFVLGYYPRLDDWRANLLLDILQNCWAAVYESNLEVHLLEEGKEPIIISGATLEELIYSNQAHFKDPKNNPKFYYHALSKSQLEPIKGHLPLVGDVSLYLSFDEDGPKTVLWMRSPRMVVKPKIYPSVPARFSGVFICDDEGGNSLLRDMEPADHRDWLASKIDSGRAVLNEINTWILEKIKELIPDDDALIVEIPDLGDYISDDEDLPELAGQPENIENEKNNGDTGEEKPKESIPDKEVNSIHTQKVATIVSAAPGDTKRRINLGKKKIKKPDLPQSPSLDPDINGSEKVIDASLLSLRSFRNKEGEYEVIIKSTENVEGSVFLSLSGEEGEYSVPIERVINKKTNEELVNKSSKIENVEIKKDTPAHLLLKIRGGGIYKLALKEST